MNKQKSLEYCLEYRNCFPDDLRTAEHFFDQGIYLKAKEWGDTPDEMEAVSECKAAAIHVLERKGCSEIQELISTYG